MDNSYDSKNNLITVEVGKDPDLSLIDYISWKTKNPSLEEANGDKSGEDAETPEFKILLQSWSHACHGFLEAFPMYSYVAFYVNHGQSGKELADFLEAEHHAKCEKTVDGKILTEYKVGQEHLNLISNHIAQRRRHAIAEEALTRSQLLALVSQYEAFVADLLRLAIQKTPESFISSTQKVDATTIIREGDIEKIRISIIEDYIADLQRNSHIEAIKTIFKQLKLQQPDDIALREFGEICLRRNTLTHANGISNRVYRREMTKLGFPEKEIAPLGEKLKITDNYMKRSIARVYQMGYFMGQLVWQHLIKDEREEAAKLIINDSHEFLSAGYTKICNRLCDFGLHPKGHTSEKDKAYLVINKALSFMLNDELEDEEKMLQVRKALSLRDWSIVDSKFAMALCCLREDYESFADLFDAVADKDFHANDFMSLAVFTKAKQQPIFKEKMLERYGVIISEKDQPSNFQTPIELEEQREEKTVNPM